MPQEICQSVQMAKYFKVDGWVRQQLGGDGKRNVSINCLKVEREDGVGDHPWVEAALRAGKVFSAVTHSSSAFHNNQIQQEKIKFGKSFISLELFVALMSLGDICS